MNSAQAATGSYRNVFVNAEHIDMLKNNYRQKNWKRNTERFGTEETLYALYPIEDVKEFAENSKKKNAEFINIYFGAFPLEYPEYSILAGRMTLCFAGAKHEADGNGNMISRDVYYGDEKSESGLSVLSTESNVAMLRKNYMEGRYKYNSETIGKSDAIGVSFPLEIFEQFISEKEKQNADGIKLYIGVYPEKFEAAPELSEMQTIVLVGTEKRHGTTSDILYGDKIGLNMGNLS